MSTSEEKTKEEEERKDDEEGEHINLNRLRWEDYELLVKEEQKRERFYR
jgi:hypothetical protein